MARRDDDTGSSRAAAAATGAAIGVTVGVGAGVAAQRYLNRKANTVSVDGKPVYFEKVDSKKVRTDAAAFQFKSGGDGAGVTDRLRDVTKWDPTSAGKIAVYEKRSGERVVADGHQRHGLAERLTKGQRKGIPMDAQVYREKDGWTVKQVRTQAALINIRQNSGKPVDIAQVLRSDAKLMDGSLPKSSTRVKQAVGLAALSDSAFGMVKSGVVDAAHASIVGQNVADKKLHASLLADLNKAGVKSAQEARLFVSQAVAAPVVSQATGDMFGHVDTRSLHAERAKVLNEALKDLSKNKRVFATLGKEAGTIEAAGNALAKGVNASMAQQAGQTHALLEKLATTTGPVSKMLNDAAREVADGKTAKAASRQFLSGISAAIKEHGAGHLMGAGSISAPAAAPPPPKPSGPSLFDDGPVKVRSAETFKGTKIPPPPPGITPKPAGGTVADLNRAVKANRLGKVGMAASLALTAVSAVQSLTARPAQAKASAGGSFERTYTKGPKAGVTETVKR